MYPMKVGIVLSDVSLWEEARSALQPLPVNVVMELAGTDDVVSVLDRVEKVGPEVLLLDPRAVPCGLGELLRDLKLAAPKMEVVVVKDRPTPDDILAAMRAGAREYLYPPLGGVLKEALERISLSLEGVKGTPQVKRGKIVGFLSVKGGCGATTLACHAATEVARMSGNETLLADLDFHSGIVRILMQSKSRYSILDAANNLQRLDPSYWRGLVSNGYEGVEVIASTPLEMPQRTPVDRELRRVMHFVRTQYDWTVADLGQGLDPLVLGELEELDSVVLVATLEVPTLQMAKLALRYMGEAGVPKDKVKLVLNRVNRRNGITQEDVESVLGVEVYASIPNDYGALEQAYGQGRLLQEGHRLRGAIGDLMVRLTGLSAAQPKKKFSLFGL